MTIYLIGAGMGSPDTMTVQAQKAIEKSSVIIGAKRLIEGYEGKSCHALISATDIADCARNSGADFVAVILSGDVGFYSGAKKLYELLDFAEVEVIAGISSFVYFCSKLKTPWQDVFALSAHGREHNAVGEIQCHERVFLLTGSTYTAADLISELCSRGLENVLVSVGERLSYDDETITTGFADELLGQEFSTLAVVLVENSQPIYREFTAPSLRDGDFMRDKVPMTKEEVRMVSVSKMRLERAHTVWDVGAGTGSVSIECAFSVPAGRVFAIERKDTAIALLNENKVKFGLTNLEIIAGLAPEALEELPAPDCVFLGGTAGNMEDILSLVFSKNPHARIVANAVTLETIAEITRCFAKFGLDDTDMVQISSTKTRKVGGYHLMDAQNPVWIIAGEKKDEQ